MARDAAGELLATEYLRHRRKLSRMHDPARLSEVLSEGLCGNCHRLLQERLRLLIHTARRRHYPGGRGDFTPESCDHDCNSEVSYHGDDDDEPGHRSRSPEWVSYSAENRNKRKRVLDDGIAGVSSYCDEDLSEEQEEKIRFSEVRKQEFVHWERIDGKVANVLQGLELHTGVFDKEEQKNIVDYVYHLQRKGRRGQLRKRTYSEPRKWMRGKGRVTIQFGCCYNYAMDKNGNPPGIVRDEEVDPLPSLFKKMIKRMVKWNILPVTCIPDSCIVNIYDEGDCIPPHIDHHDFVRPFCTVSFLTESNILFGSHLEILSPGEFSGPVSIPLPMGSVLVLSGNGADLAKHCVPSVPAKRISITFRKMDDRKLPYRFLPHPELQRIKPLNLSQLQEEEAEEEIVQAKDSERKQREHHHFYSPKPLGLLSPWQEEEKRNFRVKEGKRKQRDHHHYHSIKPLDLTQWQEEEEENVELEEGEIRQRDHHHHHHHHYYSFKQLQEEKNVQVEEGKTKQRNHHHYYSSKTSSKRSKRQRYEVGIW